MKNKKNVITQTLLYIIVIIIIATMIALFLKKEFEEDDVQTLKSDMISIQCMAKTYKDEKDFSNKDNSNLVATNNNSTDNSNKENTNPSDENSNVSSSDGIVGVKLSDCNNDIINEFKSKNVIDESDYDKYYVLSDEDLSTLKTMVYNRPNSYYLFNYDTGEVILTSGYKGCYTLTDILKLK